MNITPGKWTADIGSRENGTSGSLIRDINNFIVAEAFPRNPAGDEQIANARAISLVPEMIEALHNMIASAVPGMNWTDESGQMMLNQARNILKRIEG